MATSYRQSTFTNNVVSVADDSPLKPEADYVKAGLTATFGAISAVVKLKVTVQRVSEVLHGLQPEQLSSHPDLADRFDAFISARDHGRKQRGGRTAQDGTVKRADLASLFAAETVAETATE